MKTQRLEAGKYALADYPEITIESYYDDGTWWDIWFDGNWIGPFHYKHEALEYICEHGVDFVKKQSVGNSTGEAIYHCRENA